MNHRSIPLFIKSLAIFLLLRMVFFHSNSLYANLDTTSSYRYINKIVIEKIVIKQQDTITKKISVENKRNNQKVNIYSKLQNNAEKNYVTKKLYGLFFRKQDLEFAGRVISKINATDKFINFAGKRISSIELTRLEAFGQSVFDTTIKPTTWAENTANSLHIRTAKFLIKNNLLFKEGDLLNPVDFAETEQLLRRQSYIEDANIFVETLEDTTQVKVRVITKDNWSIGIEGNVSSTHASEVDVYDKNFGGLGLLLSGDFFRDDRYPGVWGRRGELSTSNILGSFLQSDIWFRTGQGYKTYAFALTRDFYASKAKYGGGINIINSHEPYAFRSIDSTSFIGYNNYDYWLGRSFNVCRKDLTKPPYNIILALRYLSRYYNNRPDVFSRFNYIFHNKEYYLVGLSLARQNLYKANLIYSFGSTENIPTGFRINFTSGFEKGEFEDRIYTGGEISSANLGSWGYLFSSARAGGFIASKNQMEQITYNLKTTYFTNLFNIKNLQLRQFLKVDYTRGVSRYYGEGETIFLDQGNGIRGLSSREMIGTTRMVLNIETIAFSPLFVYGFRFAYFAFCDIGFIGSAKDYLIGNQSFSGFGFGVRIRNENLVLNAIQIRLGYYPKLPSNADVAYWLISGQQRTRFENLRAREPQIVPFE